MSKGAARAEIESAAEFLLASAGGKPEMFGADVMYSFAESHSLSLMDGVPEENTSGASGGLSLRCIAKDGRQGVATVNNFSGASLEDLVDWSYANCLASEKDDGVSLYEGPIRNEDASLEIMDADMETYADAAFRMETCARMTETARGRDAKVLSVRSSSWSHMFGEMFYASTAGVSGWKEGTSASCGVAVVLKDGDSYEMGAYGKSERFASSLDPEEIARLSVDRTLRILGGRPVRTGKYTILLEPEVSASIVDEIGDMFCSSEVHKGRSLMGGRLGQSVAGGVVTLVDDARLPRRLGSSSFDCEGVPTGKTTLIDSGVANAYLYNLQHASKDGTKSTGSASRGLSSLPDVGTSNLVLRPGADSPERLMENIKLGFWVTELMGLHMIDSISGNFSLGARGVLIENGRPSGPVAGVTIADNLIDFLKKITSVGLDLEFFGSTGAPTMVVEDVTLAGK
ncbi:MAG: TldD/PmbA family protein [Synergistaceae bacterium]|jgi:PmbA protein|nr:TldD/PmbA family protein [Synergistaceae bacterium]